MDNKKIGEFIAEQRKAKNLTQKYLADQLFVSDRAVSKWERGICMPDVALLEKLAKILSVNVSEILVGERLKNKEYHTIEKNILKLVANMDKTNKRYKLLFKIVLIILIMLPILSCLFCVIDFNMVRNGKAPIFNYNSYSVNNNDRCIVTEGDCTLDKSDISTIYYGLGYKIVDCEYCHNKVYPMPLGMGTPPYERVNCKTDLNSYDYYFMDGKLTGIYSSFIIPEKDVRDVKIYEEEIKDFNTVEGCSGVFVKNYDLSYRLEKNCYLNDMSKEDIKSIYKNESFKLSLSRKELVKWHEKKEESIKCELRK